MVWVSLKPLPLGAPPPAVTEPAPVAVFSLPAVIGMLTDVALPLAGPTGAKMSSALLKEDATEGSRVKAIVPPLIFTSLPLLLAL